MKYERCGPRTLEPAGVASRNGLVAARVARLQAPEGAERPWRDDLGNHGAALRRRLANSSRCKARASDVIDVPAAGEAQVRDVVGEEHPPAPFHEDPQLATERRHLR